VPVEDIVSEGPVDMNDVVAERSEEVIVCEP